MEKIGVLSYPPSSICMNPDITRNMNKTNNNKIYTGIILGVLMVVVATLLVEHIASRYKIVPIQPEKDKK